MKATIIRALLVLVVFLIWYFGVEKNFLQASVCAIGIAWVFDPVTEQKAT